MGANVSRAANAQQIFLKYFKQNREFLLDEAETDAIFTDMMAEINSLPAALDEEKSWKQLLDEWKINVREQFKNSIELEWVDW